jgi:transcription antitermination factor NusG
MPLFAGYVFARGEAVGRIVETLGVYDVIRFDGRPALVPDADIRNIRRFVQALTATRRETPSVTFREGERVCIIAGPFRGVEGVVARARNRRRVIVGLAAIGAGFELDVPAGSVRAVG